MASSICQLCKVGPLLESLTAGRHRIQWPVCGRCNIDTWLANPAGYKVER
jgi:hypothetical protein